MDASSQRDPPREGSDMCLLLTPAWESNRLCRILLGQVDGVAPMRGLEAAKPLLWYPTQHCNAALRTWRWVEGWRDGSGDHRHHTNDQSKLDSGMRGGMNPGYLNDGSKMQSDMECHSKACEDR